MRSFRVALISAVVLIAAGVRTHIAVSIVSFRRQRLQFPRTEFGSVGSRSERKLRSAGGPLFFTSIWEAFWSPDARFHVDACTNLRKAYAAKLSGQDRTAQSLLSAVCAHIDNVHSHSPLVLLLTGPPGVGKSWSTKLTAQARTCQNPQHVGLTPFVMG